MEYISASSGEGRYQISGMAILCGQDLTITVTGGTLPHVGAVSLAVYEPVRDSATVSTITVFTHRDDQLAASCAKKVAKSLQCTVVASVGIHIDHADAKDLERLCKNFEECIDCLIQKLGGLKGER